MNVYHYDSATGVLTGSGVAFPDPLTPNAFLLPAYATFVAPPGFNAETQQAVFANGVWAVQNIPVPPAPPAPTLSAAQAAQIAALAASYTTAIAQSVSFTSAGGITKTFQSDPQSVNNLANMLAAFPTQGVLPAGFYWVAADNTQVPFTVADMQGLAKVIGAQGFAAFQHLQTQKAAVLAATTVAAVQAITW